MDMENKPTEDLVRKEKCAPAGKHIHLLSVAVRNQESSWVTSQLFFLQLPPLFLKILQCLSHLILTISIFHKLYTALLHPPFPHSGSPHSPCLCPRIISFSLVSPTPRSPPPLFFLYTKVSTSKPLLPEQSLLFLSIFWPEPPDSSLIPLNTHSFPQALIPATLTSFPIKHTHSCFWRFSCCSSAGWLALLAQPVSQSCLAHGASCTSQAPGMSDTAFFSFFCFSHLSSLFASSCCPLI